MVFRVEVQHQVAGEEERHSQHREAEPREPSEQPGPRPTPGMDDAAKRQRRGAGDPAEDTGRLAAVADER